MYIFKVMILSCTVLLHGCVSILTTFYEDPKMNKRFYSGSAMWFEMIDEWNARKQKPEAIEYIIAVPAVAIDLPLCLVADTLLLTYKFYYRSTHPEVVIPYKPDVTPADKTTPSTSTSPKAL